MSRATLWFALSVLWTAGLVWPFQARAEDVPYRIGLASVRITPECPMPMIGYSAQVSEGVLDDLYAKALAIQSGDDPPAVLITADVIFFRAPVAEAFAAKIMEATGLKRHQLLLCASHTHSGPFVGMTADLDAFGVPEDQRRHVAAYTEKLQSQLVHLVAAALAERKPARLSWGTGQVGFVVNRRVKTPGGVRMGPNPQGPVDRTVPVLRIDDPSGRLRGVLFGCACHPVTLDGSNRKLSGDYASLAQSGVQQRHPGVQAMFLAGCGGDANSHPRGGSQQEQWVRQHGESLAVEVCRVLAGPLVPVAGRLRTELAWTDLPLQHTYTREQLEEMAAKGETSWHQRNARAMLEKLRRNEPLPAHYRAPIAFWQFGGDLSLVGLPGEAVSQYVALIRQALGPRRLWIAAYVNESFGYLPTANILQEGGHESMCLTLEAGFFSPDVERVVVAAVVELARRARPLYHSRNTPPLVANGP